jgi:glycosyltransferase involved in cell wall biosynthesis
MRVCVVAEHASKRFGGEAILPFHYFRLLRARGIEAWLVTHSRTRAEMTLLFPMELHRLHFVEDTPLQRLFFRLGLLLPRRVSEATFGLANQLLTQFCQRGMVRHLVAKHAIDVVHQPIPVSPRFPSLLWNLGAPVLIGPLNGGMEYPAAFRSSESWLSRAAIAGGRSLSNLINWLLPGKRKATVVMVANWRTRQALPSGLRGSVVEFAENGVDLVQWKALPTDSASHEAKRFLFIGRLVDFKALDVAIQAITKTPGASLDVIGGGPMEATWKSLAADLGVADRVRFLGQQPQETCSTHLAHAIALVLPSIYECGGAVVLEAMAMGKPVIATAWGGPADYLDSTCGILVEPTTRDHLIHGFACAMLRLMQEPGLCRQLGAAGREKVVEFYDWDQKIDRMMDIYASTLPF